MPNLYFSALLFFLFTSPSIGQVDFGFANKVLEAGIVDSTFTLGNWSPNTENSDEFHLTYKGDVKGPNVYYRVLTSILYFGASSRRARSRVLLFDECNNYLGNYALGMTYDLPEEIKGNDIMFYHSKSNDCPAGIKAALNLEQGIPHEFFLQCEGQEGYFYSFDDTIH